MLDIDKIRETAELFWHEEYNHWMKESPMCDYIFGAGDTPEETEIEFQFSLDLAYEYYLINKLAWVENPTPITDYSQLKYITEEQLKRYGLI